MFGLGYGLDEVSPSRFKFGEEEAGGFIKAGLFSPYRMSFLESPVGCLPCGNGQFGGYSCSPDCRLEVREGFVRCSGEDCEGGKDGWVWWLWRPIDRLGDGEGCKGQGCSGVRGVRIPTVVVVGFLDSVAFLVGRFRSGGGW